MYNKNSLLLLASLCLSCSDGAKSQDTPNPPTPEPDPGVDTPTPTPTGPPNIIVILMDDVGYSDLGCYGSEIETPNIDRLANNGLRLRTFYNQARSAPTRASLLTGLYPHQVGYGSLKRFPNIPNYQGWVNTKNVFIPELLEQKGYLNIMTGKWHLGADKGCTPIRRGFNESLDFSKGGYYFYNDPEGALNLNDKAISLTDSRLPSTNWYSTELMTTAGLNYIDKALQQDKPFFWYLAYNAAHFPLQAPADIKTKYKGRYMEGWEAVRKKRFNKQKTLGLFESDQQLTPLNPLSPKWSSLNNTTKTRYDYQMAIYASIIDVMDQQIGRIISYLEQKNILNNTMIILLSDNGGNAEPKMEGRFEGSDPGSVNSIVYLGGSWADVTNTPYFLYKHHAHEGGCCTPFIIHFPSRMSKSVRGTINKDYYGHVIDIMPSIVDLLDLEYPSRYNNQTIPAMEGQSFLPLLEGKSISNERPIVVEHEGNKMYRKGKWKIVQEFKEEKWRLYDMTATPTEMSDVSLQYPYVLSSMVSEYFDKAAKIGIDTELDEFEIGKWYTPVESYFLQ